MLSGLGPAHDSRRIKWEAREFLTKDINVMEMEKKEGLKKVQKMIKDLRGLGIRTEKIAVDVDVSHSSIHKWISGIRHPRFHVIQHMEKVYKKLMKKYEQLEARAS